MADTFLQGDLAEGHQHCLGSLSAKDPGYWEGSEFGKEWGSVQLHNVVDSVSSVSSHLCVWSSTSFHQIRCLCSLGRAGACEPCFQE